MTTSLSGRSIVSDSTEHAVSGTDWGVGVTGVGRSRRWTKKMNSSEVLHTAGATSHLIPRASRAPRALDSGYPSHTTPPPPLSDILPTYRFQLLEIKLDTFIFCLLLEPLRLLVLKGWAVLPRADAGAWPVRALGAVAPSSRGAPSES